MKERKFTTKMMVEGGIFIALAMALSYVKIFTLPNGGSITAASMVPILIFAYKWGTLPGIAIGAVYGVLQFIFGPKWSFHIVSILCDYVVAFGLLGVVGMFGKNTIRAAIGVTVAILLRLLSHVISGVVVFASYAPEGQNPWIYSMIYNGSYIIPELVLTVVVFLLLIKPLRKFLETTAQ